MNLQYAGESMHVAIAFLTIIASFKWGDWKNWHKYHSTMLYIMAGGLLYEYIVSNHTLWEFHPDFLYGHKMTVIVYAMLTMPVSVLIYLSLYPDNKNWRKKIVYVLKWILVYIAVEWILMVTNRISYNHGWNIWYSLCFDALMFPMLRIHHTYPVIAYPISISIVILIMLCFGIRLS